jgi:hypothetical protein
VIVDREREHDRQHAGQRGGAIEPHPTIDSSENPHVLADATVSAPGDVQFSSNLLLC